jgi:hypothetical protein
MSKLENVLRGYQTENNNKLVEYVIDDILNQDEPLTYIKDVMYGGCVSGTVTSLIYYCDTDKFFIDYHDEIFDLVNNYKSEIGELPLGNTDFNSNNLAWFGYEWTLNSINNYLEGFDTSELEEEEEEDI